MLKNKNKVALVFLVLIVVSLLIFPGMLGPIVASIFILATLVLYAIPDWDSRPEKRRRFTPENKQLLRNALLGIGLGLTASVLVIFIPRQWSWLVIGLVSIAIIVYVVRLLRS